MDRWCRKKKRRRARNALSRRRSVSNWILQFQLLNTLQSLCHHDMTALQIRSDVGINGNAAYIIFGAALIHALMTAPAGLAGQLSDAAIAIVRRFTRGRA